MRSAIGSGSGVSEALQGLEPAAAVDQHRLSVGIFEIIDVHINLHKEALFLDTGGSWTIWVSLIIGRISAEE